MRAWSQKLWADLPRNMLPLPDATHYMLPPPGGGAATIIFEFLRFPFHVFSRVFYNFLLLPALWATGGLEDAFVQQSSIPSSPGLWGGVYPSPHPFFMMLFGLVLPYCGFLGFLKIFYDFFWHF